ncbi:MAG TPA: alpha/beta fold hydrolase [Candidatus Angelobacter sp.]|nr:alpha/beta fold hydrolase [Candidatus Angelobacter sp.]
MSSTLSATVDGSSNFDGSYILLAMKFLRILSLGVLLGASLCAQTTAASTPAETRQMVLPSHGSMLLGIFYLAAGAGPHPTAIILHGFPGFEQNLDIAQALRARGWNVMAMHYRGSWGAKGNFSFAHAAEDADTEIHFLLDPANARKYRIDTHHIVVIGHSMGGYMAASATAHNPQVAAAVLISAWNIGTDYQSHRHTGSSAATISNEAKELASDNNLLPLSGTSGMALAREIQEHQKELNFDNLAPRMASRPVFVITANEGLAPADHSLVDALQKAGDKSVKEQHFDTDHSYSDKRAELISAIEKWLQSSVLH